ncbi:hypothetical protein [Agrococcus sp. ARC_14]|uniref:hypothetical protein n=1 Tax=Agrococcus sp. ARC_14 TaxID=2919927 RepID=UPI001F0566C7|nr:hypothetical protein [Agrococcus sp. ARC_14]MCH1882380.1 hypothetical protein [Agrococcus sp. ARC_14]
MATEAMRASALARRQRALAASLVVSAATTVVTGLAHSLGGGAAPDPLLLATAFVVTLLVLAPVLGTRGSFARQAVAVTAAQLVQHGLYSLPQAAGSAAHGAHAHGSHAHDAAVALQPVALHEHAGMPLAHVVAGAVTLALLRLVPRAVEACLDAMSLRRVVAVLVWTAAPARRRASVTAVRPAFRRALDVLRCAHGTRGPPLLVV